MFTCRDHGLDWLDFQLVINLLAKKPKNETTKKVVLLQGPKQIPKDHSHACCTPRPSHRHQPGQASGRVLFSSSPRAHHLLKCGDSTIEYMLVTLHLRFGRRTKILHLHLGAIHECFDLFCIWELLTWAEPTNSNSRYWFVELVGVTPFFVFSSTSFH